MNTLKLAAMAALLPMTALAHDGIAVKDAYARSANPMSGAAFMQIENHRDTDCVLESATSAVSAKTEMHAHRDVDGVMKMVEVESIAIPAGQTHALERGADHVMFLGLNQPFENGQTVAVTLDFGDCGTVNVEAVVDNDRQPASAAAPAHAGH